MLTETYRLLGPREMILPGDQFKMHDLDDSHWAPVEAFVDHYVDQVVGRAGRVDFRRLVKREQIL